MRKRTLTVGLLTTAASAIAVVGLVTSAGAGLFDGNHSLGEPSSQGVPAIFEPGATVTQNADGTTSAVGQLTPEAIAERSKAYAIADAGPQSITCSDEGRNSRCSPIQDAEALSALRRGATIYQRTVHGGITQRAIDARMPFFAADDIVCDAQNPDGTMMCTGVTARPPSLGSGQSTIITYRLLHVTFKDGQPVERPLPATVPLTRAAG